MSNSSRILFFALEIAVFVFTAMPCQAQTPIPLQVAGRSPVEINDPHIKNIACWAVEKMDETTDSIYEQALVDVVSGTEQLVSGVLYELTIRVMETAREKNGACNELCVMRDCNAAPKVCNVVVWEQAWLNARALMGASCN